MHHFYVKNKAPGGGGISIFQKVRGKGGRRKKKMGFVPFAVVEDEKDFLFH